LGDSLPKQLYTSMPIIHLLPTKDRAPPSGGVYRLPVYKILSRRGVLATTGHSTNFVMWMELPADRTDLRNNEGYADQLEWIKAGVAGFCSLKY
jgi:dynein heavy chain